MNAAIFQPAPFDPAGYRYSSRSFPAYRHIPRVTPHPRRHREGHHFGKPEPATTTFDPQRWFASEEYLYGIDLYNFAYYWEAHEAWENCWKGEGVIKMAREFLQGLIQISAALLKREQGLPKGMKNLAHRGLARLEKVSTAHKQFGGIDITEFVGRMRVIFLANDLAQWPVDPRIRLPGITPVNGKKREDICP